MKKLLLFAFASTLLISCRKDEDSENIENSLIGTWHPYEWGVKSGKDGTKIQWESNDDCEKKSTLQLKKDGTLSVRDFISKANGTCEDQGTKNGNYTYNESKKELITKVENEQSKYQVIYSTDNELQLQEDIQYDLNGDGINDPHIIVLRK